MSHATGGAQCGQSRSQNADDDLNHGLPSFLLHSFRIQDSRFRLHSTFLAASRGASGIIARVATFVATGITASVLVLVFVLTLVVLHITAVARGDALQHVAVLVETGDLNRGVLVV